MFGVFKLNSYFCNGIKYRLMVHVNENDCKFAEMLLEYFDTDIERIEISSLLIDGYDKFKKVANHAEEI